MSIILPLLRENCSHKKNLFNDSSPRALYSQQCALRSEKEIRETEFGRKKLFMGNFELEDHGSS